MSKIVLAENEKIIAVVPEYASGPGWANLPLWVHIVNNQNKYRVECIQPNDQTLEMQILFRLCCDAHYAMMKAISPLVLTEKQKLLNTEEVVKTEYLTGPRGGKATIHTLHHGSKIIIYRSSHLPVWIHDRLTTERIFQHISANTWLVRANPAGEA